MYVFFYCGASLFMEVTHGMGAIKHLTPYYPYNDKLLLPSSLYILGMLEHQDSITAVLEYEQNGTGVDPDEPF